MIRRIKLKLILAGLSLMSILVHAQPMQLDSFLETLAPGDLFDKSLLKATKAVTFNKTGGDAGEISKITLVYFASTDCSGARSGSAYTTPDVSPTFSVSNGTPFGLGASALWNAGADAGKAGIGAGSMSGINSVSVILKSTDNDTPQANFTGSACGTNPSFCCVPVDCTVNDECTSDGLVAAQDFTLKTTAAIGDPAEGGFIACLISAGDSFDLVASISDNSSALHWGVNGATGAVSATAGSANTTTIVDCLTRGIGCAGGIGIETYAAGLCENFSTGPFESWFLPAPDQMSCLYDNKASFGGLPASRYWTSREVGSTSAYQLDNDGGGGVGVATKAGTFGVRCVSHFVP